MELRQLLPQASVQHDERRPFESTTCYCRAHGKAAAVLSGRAEMFQSRSQSPRAFWSAPRLKIIPRSPVFGLAILYHTGSESSRFWYVKTRGRKIAIE